MSTDRLVRYAARQTLIVVAASATVPITGMVLLILLNTLEGLFCEQLISLVTDHPAGDDPDRPGDLCGTRGETSPSDQIVKRAAPG